MSCFKILQKLVLQSKIFFTSGVAGLNKVFLKVLDIAAGDYDQLSLKAQEFY